MAEDWDIDVQEWLRSGSPMGIESQAEPRGIFPEVNEAIPTSERRPLEHHQDNFENYCSLVDDLEGIKSLLELVEAGFLMVMTP